MAFFEWGSLNSAQFATLIAALTSFFKPSTNPITTAMIKTYTFLSAILADKPLTVKDGTATVTVAQLDAIEDALAEPTKQVVEDNKPGGEHNPKNDVQQFVDTSNSAKALYNEV